MADSKYTTLLSEAIRHIDHNHPSAAIAALREAVTDNHLWNYSDELDALSNSYKYMVEYMLNNGNDPGRDTFVADMLATLRTIADRIRRDVRAIDESDLYSAQVRIQRVARNSPAALITRYLQMTQDGDNASRREREQVLADIFNAVWATFPLSGGDLSMLTLTATDETAPMELRSQIVSALMMGALQYYERGRIEALMTIYGRSSSIAVKARALMAMVLALYAKSDRASKDTVLTKALSDWTSDPDNERRLRMVVMDIIRSLDTERINKTLREDFIPTVNKMKPTIDKLFKSGNPMPDGELNPEWEEMLTSSGLDKKLQDLTEMQAEGADLMMFAFSNLKNFGFFRDMANWFLPFDANHSKLDSSREYLSPAVLTLLEAPGMMCDSDKYSLALSLRQVPPQQRDMLLSQLKSQEENLRESVAEAQLTASDSDNIFKSESGRYIRDINRFFKLFREHRQFRDILHHPFSITDIPVLGEASLSDSEQLRLLGEFYLRRGYHADALAILRIMEKREGSDGAVLEKIGYCLQQQGDYEEALTEYRKAELFSPDSQWLLRHIAATARMTRRFADAAEYYERILEREPENINVLMNLANSYVELGDNDKALHLYYKVNYLRPDHLNSLRAIAWLEYLDGNLENSLDYHRRVLSLEAVPSDHFNAAHASLASGDARAAIDGYVAGIEAAESKQKGMEAFLKVMADDRDTLIIAGCEPSAIDIITDYVMTKIDR